MMSRFIDREERRPVEEEFLKFLGSARRVQHTDRRGGGGEGAMNQLVAFTGKQFLKREEVDDDPPTCCLVRRYSARCPYSGLFL
jgi:hypothetical protein